MDCRPAALAEEVEVLKSIYGEGCVTAIHDSCVAGESLEALLLLKVQNQVLSLLAGPGGA